MNKIWFVACTELNKAADSIFLTIKKSEEFIFQCIDVLGQRGALADLKVMVNHGSSCYRLYIFGSIPYEASAILGFFVAFLSHTKQLYASEVLLIFILSP